MKSISNIAPYVFFIFAAVCLFNVTGISPLFVESRRQTATYDPQMVFNYSETEAHQIFRGHARLETTDIQNLFRWQKPEKQAQEPKQCDDCKEAVSLIKSERDDRITAEKENKSRSNIIFISTLLVGSLIFALKHKKWGPGLIQSDETRSSTTDIVEYAFGIWILYLSTFF